MWRFRSAAGEEDNINSLNGNVGRQTWHFEPSGGTREQREEVERAREHFSANIKSRKHSSDEILRLQAQANRKTPQRHFPPQSSESEPEVVEQRTKAAIDFYSGLQASDGHFPADYGGPMFLLPGLLIALYTTNTMQATLSNEHMKEMRRYLMNHQNSDGGFGLHIEGGSAMFGTVLSYVALRILGEGKDEEACRRSRRWMLDRGGAVYSTSWGKFWLAALGVYEWEGVNPLPPELWLLPYSLPIHPGRLWCHCRMVYLPMSHVYGMKGRCETTHLTESLRNELYCERYVDIKWDKCRNLCAKEDLYYPHPLVQDAVWWTLSKIEPHLQGSKLRKRALERCMEHIHYEDENTRFICIGPVNKAINMLSCFFEDPNDTSGNLERHLPRVKDFLWVAEDGMKMKGYNGSQFWDLSFALQALLSTRHHRSMHSCQSTIAGAEHFLERTQVQEDCPGKLKDWYRHVSNGAWPFSTRDHGWPITDCTAEGVKACLQIVSTTKALSSSPAECEDSLPISQQRLRNAIDVILSLRNQGSGAFATYENTRSYAWIENLNPAETFGDIMIDYPHVECTSACLQALKMFHDSNPKHRPREVKEAMRTSTRYLESAQRQDGSWYGNWAVCFTYATWFGIEGLLAGGHTKTSRRVRKAVEFLLSKQREDGGWGESYLSCQDKVYSQLQEDEPHVVNTSWALISLLKAGAFESNAGEIHCAAKALMRLQMSNGDFPQQHISGVFNRNCMISYANYRNIFPIWALGLYEKALLREQL